MRKLLPITMLALAACGGANVQVNPKASFPVQATATNPVFLFPINMSHLGAEGDANAMGLSVSAGIIAKFGKTVVSGQQLFDLVGNLSYDLAEQIRSQVEAKSFAMTGGAEPIASGLAKLMSAILQKLAQLGLIPAGYNFKYIIAVHSHGSPSMGGKMLSVDSWGGLYDVETKQIVSYIESSDKYANDSKAILGQLPLAYNTIIEQLLKGQAK